MKSKKLQVTSHKLHFGNQYCDQSHIFFVYCFIITFKLLCLQQLVPFLPEKTNGLGRPLKVTPTPPRDPFLVCPSLGLYSLAAGVSESKRLKIDNSISR